MTNLISTTTECDTISTNSIEAISSICSSITTDSEECSTSAISASSISDDRYFLRGKRFRS